MPGPSLSAALDWLYPPICALCQIPLRRGRHLCPGCCEDLPPLPDSCCRRCAQTFDGRLEAPESCPNCLDLRPAFDFATSALNSSEASIQLIHHLKLLRRPEIAPDLARVAAPFFEQDARLAELDDPLLIPVPLHGSRHRERGFNQAEALARPLAKHLALGVSLAVKRVRPTPRQATLSRQERQKNLKNAFQLRIPPQKLAGRSLVLIDDVLTTGVTINECARVLRKAKPAQVAVFTIVRA